MADEERGTHTWTATVELQDATADEARAVFLAMSNTEPAEIKGADGALYEIDFDEVRAVQ